MILLHFSNHSRMDFSAEEQWAIFNRLPISDERREIILEKIMKDQLLISQNASGRDEKEEESKQASSHAREEKEMGSEKEGENARKTEKRED